MSDPMNRVLAVVMVSLNHEGVIALVLAAILRQWMPRWRRKHPARRLRFAEVGAVGVVDDDRDDAGRAEEADDERQHRSTRGSTSR